jgi:hypothetical protein
MTNHHRDPPIGRRPLVELEWVGRTPGRKVLARLNRILASLDYDAPDLTERGCLDVWRKPLHHPAVIAAVLHAMGWPCRWRAVPDCEALQASVYAAEWRWDRVDMDAVERAALDAIPWEASDPQRLWTVRPWDVSRLRGWSRSVDALLPPAGPWISQGRRVFGKRRGPRKFRSSP